MPQKLAEIDKNALIGITEISHKSVPTTHTGLPAKYSLDQMSLIDLRQAEVAPGQEISWQQQILGIDIWTTNKS